MNQDVKNIIGQKFGRLTVVSELENPSKRKFIYFICKCECGAEVRRTRANLLRNEKRNHKSRCRISCPYRYKIFREDLIREFVKSQSIAIGKDGHLIKRFNGVETTLLLTDIEACLDKFSTQIIKTIRQRIQSCGYRSLIDRENIEEVEEFVLRAVK